MKAAFLIILTLTTSSAFAELRWAKTPFWQTPYESDQQVIMEIVPYSQFGIIEKDYYDIECDSYLTALSISNGKTYLNKRELDTLRKESGENGVFSARFRVVHAVSQQLIKRTINDANSLVQTQMADPLPYYSLAATEMNPVEGFTGVYSVPFEKGSLSEISNGLGLVPLGVSVTGTELQNTVLVVKGRDTVCDLIAGKATIKGIFSGSVKISATDQMHLVDFYSKFEDITAYVFEKRKSLTGRAALLGFKLGEVLFDISNRDSELTGSRVSSLVAQFFDEDLQRNQYWSVFDKTPHLSVNGRVSVPDFNVILGGAR